MPPPYEITTIGGMLGSCECGAERKLDVQKIAGLVDTAGTLAGKINPFSDEFLPYQWARDAARTIEQKAEAASKAAGALRPDPLPTALDIIGVPTWGYSGTAITVAALLGTVAVGAFVVYRVRAKKNGAKKRKP